MCPDTSRTESTECAFRGCTRPVWRDPDGSYSSFCSRTHLEGAAKLSQQNLICKNCQEKPVYVEGNTTHDFCGMRCATAYRNGQRHPSRPITSHNAVCSLPGCSRLAFKDRDGNIGEYCSQAHRQQGVRDRISEACLACGQLPKNIINDKLSDFCSKACANNIVEGAPTILEVTSNTRDYQQVSHQFTTQWKHPTRVPTVIKIWKVYGSRDHNNSFTRYKLTVERKTQLQNGNTRRRFHGTTRMCRLGDTSADFTFCEELSCSLCSILQWSFDLANFGQRTNFGRFGTGIYTSATSSKADGYIQENESPYHAMLLNEVVMGETIKLTMDDPSLTQPPAGYDSVVGEPGDILNYDESIVYKNEAIRPVYLIIFEH